MLSPTSPNPTQTSTTFTRTPFVPEDFQSISLVLSEISGCATSAIWDTPFLPGLNQTCRQVSLCHGATFCSTKEICLSHAQKP